MCEVIKVNIADMKVCKEPNLLATLGLGSCVGVVLYDSVTKVSGMVHVMLPDSTKIKDNTNRAKFADTGIPDLLNKILSMGASRTRVKAKIAGGAKMFSFGDMTSDFMQVGDRNVKATKQVLKMLQIDIIAEDTGLDYGRTIIFDSVTGLLKIKAVGKPEKYI